MNLLHGFIFLGVMVASLAAVLGFIYLVGLVSLAPAWVQNTILVVFVAAGFVLIGSVL